MARVTWLSAVVALGFVVGCVSDPKIEINVEPSVGIVEPVSDGGGTKIGAAAACDELVTAETAVRTKLGCAPPKVVVACPQKIYLAGAEACTEYIGSTVTACAKAIGAYTACSDFDTKPCVATVVAASCGRPAVVDAGKDKDSGFVAPPKADSGAASLVDSGTTAEAGPADAGRG